MSRPRGRWLRRLAWLALVVVAVNLVANLARQARSRRRAPIGEDGADRPGHVPLPASARPVGTPEPAAEPEPQQVTEPEPAAESEAGPERLPAWVAPVDKACPDGFPVKAKVASGVYHVPGGLSYARTVPDRCYASPEQAEADGFRPAKR